MGMGPSLKLTQEDVYCLADRSNGSNRVMLLFQVVSIFALDCKLAVRSSISQGSHEEAEAASGVGITGSAPLDIHIYIYIYIIYICYLSRSDDVF